MGQEFLTEVQVAAILGRSRSWLLRHRPTLEREGFPRVDSLVRGTCWRDLNAWIARRRRVADDGEAERRHHTNNPGDGVNYDSF